MTVLTDRFARAVDYARIAYAAQVGKRTTIPYVTIRWVSAPWWPVIRAQANTPTNIFAAETIE